MYMLRLVGQVRNVCTAILQSQKAVSAHFTSKQILPFGFAERCNAREEAGTLLVAA